MPTTLTLKNIPDAVYQRLKASAESNRRSLNSEAIVRLEAALLAAPGDTRQRLARARALRAGLSPAHFAPADIAELKRQGRP